MIGDFFASFVTYMSDIGHVLSNFRLVDLLDIMAIAFIFYHALKLVRETRAMQLIKSIAVIFVVYFLANELDMTSLKFLMGSVLNIGLITLVVLFQPELRRALEQVGRSKLAEMNVFGGSSSNTEGESAKIHDMIDIIVAGSMALAAEKYGALIVIERKTKLGEIINSGTIVDAAATPELIENIFFKNSPLHDGAMIVRGGRLYAAGCYLPLSSNMEIARELGTRHRAALGMTEVSDAVVVVVSEETGAITIAADARLQRHLSEQGLKRLLTEKLSADKSSDRKKSGKPYFWQSKNK